MPKLITMGNELIRINPSNNHIEYSTSAGRIWMMRNGNSYAKTFTSIQDGGREMLAMTEDGHLYYSTSEGMVWMRRR